MRRALFGSLLASACLAGAMAAGEDDPLEGLNRKILALNYGIDTAFIKPLARVYVTVVPGFARKGVRNVVNNLREPRTALNQCLQGKLDLAVSDAARFVVNSTIGVAGLFDPASAMGLARHDEDFGQTLGRWGVGQGAYVVLPVFGPSTMRDGVGRGVDLATGTRLYIDEDEVRYGLGLLGVVDSRSDWLGELNLPEDPYVALRESYLARREREVADVVVTSPEGNGDDAGAEPDGG
ncbi:MAG: VacJ family lipoprotein [Gammaproteobacteria bacterium]|nr:VacJ family lipoprotein [Gammaproteobacteria bacterium]MYF30443.1 VacJ family lipoprotein [Gammaproteobacteria bacterium]MYK47525.1 VacJ family lipoprotein [Gammaproteobacteria bacterium]